jgi:hypothetical protein
VSALPPAEQAGGLRDRLAQVPAAGVAALAALVAAGFGAALPDHPVEALAVICLVPLAFAAPVAALAVVLSVTALVPYDLQNRLSVGGGTGVPGLLLVDVLLLLGLCRIALLLLTRRMRPAGPVLVAGALLALFTAAMLNGIAEGASASDAGNEARCLLLGAGAFILAWPLLVDPPARRRLYGALLALGLAVGLWGLVQWVFKFDYTAAGDVGVRPGIDQIAAVGGGQLQGGLFAYPVAVTLSFAVLLSGAARSAGARALAAGIFALNGACVLVTYERTTWGAALIGCLVVAVAFGRGAWRPALMWSSLGLAGLLVLAAVGPGSLGTAYARATSVLQYRSDNSVQARQVESHAVVAAIRRHPVTGEGFGTTVTWGKRDVFGTTTTSYTHNGFLWLTWKLGIPLSLLVVALVAAVALRRRRRGTHDPPADRVMRLGSQGALVTLLLSCVTFPIFNTLGITAVMGLLVAVCAQARGRRSAGSGWT